MIKYQKRDPFPFPYTAMLDILFLLVVFLVLGSNFDDTTEITLPVSQQGRVLLEERADTLMIELRTDGSAWVKQQHLSTNSWQATISAIIEVQRPKKLMLMPDANAPVQALLSWHERLQTSKLPLTVAVQRDTP